MFKRLMEDLKTMVAQMQGQTYQRPAPPTLPDLRTLHPRGAARYAEHDSQDRVEQMLKTDS